MRKHDCFTFKSNKKIALLQKKLKKLPFFIVFSGFHAISPLYLYFLIINISMGPINIHSCGGSLGQNIKTY